MFNIIVTIRYFGDLIKRFYESNILMESLIPLSATYQLEITF